MSICMFMVVLFSCKIVAQNAETLFKKHHKWGVIGQYNVFEEADITSTNNPNLSYEIFESKLFSLGLAYNFYQYKNWNFKAELQLQWFGHADRIFISEEENVTPWNIDTYSWTEHDKIGYMPITAEYVFLNKGDFSFSVGAGFGLTYYWHYDVSGSRSFSINNNTLFEAFEIDDYPLFYFSNHIQVSTYFKRKFFMLQASLIYKKSYTPFREGTYEFKNLEMSPDVSGSIEQSGDFIGFGLTIYPKRFKKKQ